MSDVILCERCKNELREDEVRPAGETQLCAECAWTLAEKAEDAARRRRAR